jgi:hypothetical protein
MDEIICGLQAMIRLKDKAELILTGVQFFKYLGT